MFSRAGGNVDGITEDVVVIQNDVTDMNADPEFDPLVRRYVGILFGHTSLDFNCTADRIDGASKLDQHAIDLERDLGVPLFDRSSRGAELTPSGDILLRRGRAMLDELQQGLQEIENLSDPTVGEVRIGAVDAWSAYISTIVEQTSRRYRKLTYKVVFGDSDMLVTALRNRTLDVVMTRASIARPLPDLNAEVLFHDRIAVVAFATHPLARRRKITLRDLLEERWIIGPPGSFLHQLLTEALQAEGLAMPNATVTTLSIQLRLDCCKLGTL